MRSLTTISMFVMLANPSFSQETNLENAATNWSYETVELGDETANKRRPVVTSIRIQPNGTHIAIAGDDHSVRIWDMETNRPVCQLKGHQDWVRCIAYTPDGTALATAGNDRRIILWNATTGEKKEVLAEHHEAITNLEYSHNGQMLAATGFETHIHLYDAKSGEVLFDLDCPCRDMRALAFSLDDRVLAAGGRNGKIRMYQCENGQTIRDIAAHRQRIRGLLFTTDGSQLISCGEDRIVRVTSVAADSSFVLPRRPTKFLAMALYAPGRLATAGTDNVIRLWDLDTKEEIGQLNGHTGSVAALASDRDVLVSGGFDTTVRIWKIRRNVAGETTQPARVGAAVRNNNDFE